MLRRERHADRSSVPVEITVNELDASDSSTAPFDGVVDGVVVGDPLTTQDIGAAAGLATGHERSSTGGTPLDPAGETSGSSSRTPRWPVIAVVVVLLGGIVLWLTGRGSDTNADLPTLPRRPSEQFSFTVDRALVSQVSVTGSAQSPFVMASTLESATLYALDRRGALRWSTDLGVAGDASGSDSIHVPSSVDDLFTIDGLIVTTTIRYLIDDNGTMTGAETSVRAIDPETGSAAWQKTTAGMVWRRVEDSLILVVTEPDGPGHADIGPRQNVELRAVDLVTAEEVSRNFDGVGFETFARATSTAPLLAKADGTVFMVGGDLTAVSEPIPVDDAAVFGASDDEIAIVDGDVATLYDSDGNVTATAVLEVADADGWDGKAPPVAVVAATDGTWWFGGMANQGIADVAAPYCAPLPFDTGANGTGANGTGTNGSNPTETDAGVGDRRTGEEGLAECWDTVIPALFSAGVDLTIADQGTAAGTLVTTESAAFTIPADAVEPSSTAGDTSDGTTSSENDVFRVEINDEDAIVLDEESARNVEFTSWDEILGDVTPTTVVGLNGYVEQDGTNLVGTRLPDEGNLFTLPLPPSARWAVIDGAIAIWEPDNSGSSNAVKVTIYA